MSNNKAFIYLTMAGLTAALVIMASFAFIGAIPNWELYQYRVTRSLSLPAAARKTKLQSTQSADEWRTHTVSSGETLSLVFSNLGLSGQTLQKIIDSSETAAELARIHPGRTLKVLLDENGILDKLLYFPNRLETIEVSSTGAGYTTTKSRNPTESRISHAHGIIRSSLSNDAKAAGLPEKLVMKIASIFAWDIDFAMDLRIGDRFAVIYEELYIDGEIADSGSILAAEFVNRGKSHVAIRYQSDDGEIDYYSPEGESVRKAFLRSPVKYARISSHFNLKRRHPVLNRIRAHKGVDYAAPTGTPVHSTSKGKVVFRGRKGGYGRVVIVQHGKNYSTLYAHLSGFSSKAKKGSLVKQGQRIGYIGKSGLATGPHLHYEFRVNGVHRNPLKIKLHQSHPIERSSLAAFKTTTAPLLSQLAMFRPVLLAQAGGPGEKNQL